MLIKLKCCVESIIIFSIGLICLQQSFKIRSNPIELGSKWINIFAQAKFLPIVVSCMTILLAVVLFLKQYKACDVSEKIEKGELKQFGVLIVIITAYIISAYLVGFIIPTVIFAIVSLFYLNYKTEKKVKILFIAAVYIVVSLYVLPNVIMLQLP